MMLLPDKVGNPNGTGRTWDTIDDMNTFEKFEYYWTKFIEFDLGDWIIDGLKDAGIAVWEATKNTIVEGSYFVVLIGGGICILLYAAGHKKSLKYLSSGTLIYILIQYIFA